MTSARWFRMGLGLVLLLVPLWVLLSRFDAIWNGHPAYPAILLTVVGVGLVLIGTSARAWRSVPDDNRRASPWRIVGRVVIALLAVAVIGVLIWLRPFPAGAVALDAMRSDAAVTVVDHPTTIELVPTTAAEATAGLVFSPGARVDARAYAALLRPVAEAGFLVVILKEPLGLAITQIGQSAGPIADHPEIGQWAVGGHSLGGVSAAWFAADHLDVVDGLVLWASFPNDDMSGDASLRVLSLFGSNDLLATPADIDRSRSSLPPDTTFFEIDGGVHAFFADYGEQPGDGVPAISRQQAANQISSATTDFMTQLATDPSYR